MRIVFFCHSLRSDWNHGNAHFLRGLIRELAAAGHDLVAYEPGHSWSASNLADAHGIGALEDYRAYYPALPVRVYEPENFDVAGALDGADLAIVHEWNSPELVAQIGRFRKHSRSLRVLFHDTHHRSVTDPDSMAQYDLGQYDGVLAFGESISEKYRERGWTGQVWTFHEAADTRVFFPHPRVELMGDLVWVGNWGDDERTAELREFLIQPAAGLKLSARVHGVRYPTHAVDELKAAGISYQGWLPNYRVPETFAQYRFTVHVPRRPYARSLTGIPTIRVFEALACGIPLISAPWEDTEHLFEAGSYLEARSGSEMRGQMRVLLNDGAGAAHHAETGLRSIRERHTCEHRAAELLAIYASIAPVRVEAAA